MFIYQRVYTWIIESIFHDLRTSSTVESFMRLCAVLVCQIHRHLLSWAHTPNRSVHTPNRSAGQSVRPLWANMAMDFRRSWISGEAKNISSDKNTIESYIYIYGMQNSHMELLGTRTITLDDALFFVRGCRKKPLATTAGPLAEQKLVHTMPFWWVLSHPQVALNIWVSFAMVYNRRYHRIHYFWQEKRIMKQWIQTLLPIFWGFPIIFWLISRFFP